MSSIKLQTNDAEGDDSSGGDMLPAESEHSNSSRENVETDCEDSSEMDEGECETRRKECMQILPDLQQQFAFLREQLYRERIAQVDNQLQEVKEGRSQEYLEPLQELEKDMRKRIKVAGVLRKLRLANVKNKSDAEVQAAKQNFKSEKRLAFDYFYEKLMNQIRRLEENRPDSELNRGEVGERSSRSRSRSRKKPATVSGPYIVYLLKPQDIKEDLSIIRKALKRSA